MTVEHITSTSTPFKTMDDEVKNVARLNVLYSPFRKREVNPQDWESKMAFWKNNIMNYCIDCKSCVFTVAKLQSSFQRNGRTPLCITTVLEDMLRNNEIIHVQDLLSKDPSLQSWSTWAVNCFVKTPIVWSFNKLKESLIAKADNNLDEEYVHINVLKSHADLLRERCKNSSTKQILSLEEVKAIVDLKDDLSVKVTLHWLRLQGQADVTTVNNKTIVKLSSANERVKPISEADVGLYQLQRNEQTLMQMLEQLEKEKQDAEQEARNYLKKGMRQVAKSCLRKKRELEKCIDKRASALENVHVLLSRVKEAESDGEILESYKMGLSALKATFKEAGLSEDGVGATMDQVKEVLEVHEEIQRELSEPMADSVEEDLENELAELLAGQPEPASSDTTPLQPGAIFDRTFSDLPEPPTYSPTTSPRPVASKIAQIAHPH